MTDIPSGRLFRVSAIATAALLASATIGIFLVAPEDADQGVIQRIFYFHVAIALTSLVAFGVALVAGLLYLRRRTRRWDELGVVSVRLGLMFSVLTILTGSIWAKASWDRFSSRFANKDTLNGKFGQMAELRNGIRHSRSVDQVARKEGEAAILWFEQVLSA